MIQIELWDEDLDWDDQMDLDGVNSDDKRLDLIYDTVEQLWQGDGVSGSYPDYSIAGGEGDGGDDGWSEEKDGKIKFTIYTDAEISPSQQQELAETYSPVLYFHRDESYFPVDIGSFLSQSTLVKSGPNIHSPTPDDLAENPSSSNYLDLWGNFENVYNPTVYSRVFTATDNKIVIQYWFFYLYNPGTEGLTAHEGDWEMIQIICDEEGNPQKAGYSQHYGGAKKSWSNVEKVDGTHPKVYVALGGHASYFESGSTSFDDHTGNGLILASSDYSLNIITNDNWLNFRGDWGEDSGSVPGPVFRHTKSYGPGDWISQWSTTKSHMWIGPLYWHSVIG
ncbi:MAG: hypothetical protein R6U17_01985 [Thermoplasmata archaeon]